METLREKLMQDIRFEEGLKSCFNCGTCTAICPGAEFYNYDPRALMNNIQKMNDEEISNLIKSDYIWYCGECMSCKTRCPRGNAPGLVIMALRNLAMETGSFVESEKGRQQLFMKRVVVGWILKYGYCLYLDGIGTDLYPEQGPIWDWRQDNWSQVMERLGANYKGEGVGILRKIPDEALEEIHNIFKETGGMDRLEEIEKFSKEKAIEMNIDLNDELINDYILHIYHKNSIKKSDYE